MKSVQGDSGHAQAKMVADVYSHILDEDRRINAQRFEDTFYSPKAKQPSVEDKQAETQSPQTVDTSVIFQLMSDPNFIIAVQKAMSDMGKQ